MAKQKKKQKSPQGLQNPSKATTSARYRFNNKVVAVLILGITFLLYGNTLSHQYTLDDAIVITQNSFTQKGFSGINDLLTHDTFYGFFNRETDNVAGGRYRPLSLVTFAMEIGLFGKNRPGISHLINLLLYAISCLLIYFFLRRLLASTKQFSEAANSIALLTSLLFLAHPIHTEAIANIKGRDEILAILFSVWASMHILIYLDEEKKITNLIWAGVILFLGMISKENAFLFLFVIPLSIFFFRKISVRQYLIVLLPLFVAAAVFLFLRQQFTNTAVTNEVTEILNNPFAGASLSEKYATIVYTFGIYLLLLILPLRLSHDYYYNQIPLRDIADPLVLLSGFICIVILVIALLQMRKKTLFSFCVLFFAITFSVVSNLFFPVGTTLSERFLFMPSLGFCIWIAYLFHQLPLLKLSGFFSLKGKTIPTVHLSWSEHKPVVVLAICLIGFYSVRTILRNPAWENNLVLFSTDVQHSPNSAKLNNALGGQLLDESKALTDPIRKKEFVHQAGQVLDHAVEIYPQYLNAWLLRGNAWLMSAPPDFKKALSCYNNCLTIDPDYELAFTNIDILFNQWKNEQERISFYRLLLNKMPSNARLSYEAGIGHENLNQYDSALWYFTKSISIKPDYGDAYVQCGVIFGQHLNQLDSSIWYLQKAIEVDADNITAYENLGVALGIKGDKEQAISIFEKGIKVSPNHAPFYYNLGVTYQQMGNETKANSYFEKANALDPKLKK